MIEEIFAVSRVVIGRNKYEVLSALMEEVGELATEVAVQEGYSHKPQGKDGILGEAIDVMICAVDMIYVSYPNLPKGVVEKILIQKLEKWKKKAM